jgi:hypothetical protein
MKSFPRFLVILVLAWSSIGTNSTRSTAAQVIFDIPSVRLVLFLGQGVAKSVTKLSWAAMRVKSFSCHG